MYVLQITKGIKEDPYSDTKDGTNDFFLYFSEADVKSMGTLSHPDLKFRFSFFRIIYA